MQIQIARALAMTFRTRVAGALLLDGRYRLESPLAVGGMGSIWRAMHTTLDRAVAVKFIDVGSADDVVIERFLREAMVTAGIRHPNVIDVLDFGRLEGGEAFMVMEFLEGLALDERLGKDPGLTTIQVVQIAGQILSGLEAVHRSGIVHCDVKPGNVVVTDSDDGEPFARLVDFGIAYTLDPRSELRRGRLGLTSDRIIVGTPEYMSPEQARGTDLDARADLYSVGVLLYESLSGRLPYIGDDPHAIIQRVLVGECTPLGLLRPDISEITDVIESAMQHDREQRPSSAREFRRQLFAAAGLKGDPTGLSHLPGRSSVAELPAHVSSGSGLALRGSPDAISLPGRFDASRAAARARVGLLALAAALTLALTGAGWALFAGSDSSAHADAAPVSARDRAIVETEPVATPIASLAPIGPAAAARGLVPTPSADAGAPATTADEPAGDEIPRRAPRPRAPSERSRASGDLVRELDF